MPLHLCGSHVPPQASPPRILVHLLYRTLLRLHLLQEAVQASLTPLQAGEMPVFFTALYPQQVVPTSVMMPVWPPSSMQTRPCLTRFFFPPCFLKLFIYLILK